MAELPVLSLTKSNDLTRSFEKKRVLATDRDLNDVDGAYIDQMRRKTPHDALTTELPICSITYGKQRLMRKIQKNLSQQKCISYYLMTSRGVIQSRFECSQSYNGRFECRH